MEKQAPQKALCLGPDPPRGFSIKFIKIMVFFGFWAFNTAGKSVTKVGIYALPPLGGPQKVNIFENYRFLMKTWRSKNEVLKFIDSWLRQFIATQFHTAPFFLKLYYR
jgi:hypothetical protein